MSVCDSRVDRMWRHLACCVYYDKICIKFASHHLLLLYVAYMCQKSLNFTYAFKCYQQNVSGFTLAGPPCKWRRRIKEATRFSLKKWWLEWCVCVCVFSALHATCITFSISLIGPLFQKHSRPGQARPGATKGLPMQNIYGSTEQICFFLQSSCPSRCPKQQHQRKKDTVKPLLFVHPSFWNLHEVTWWTESWKQSNNKFNSLLVPPK